MIERIAQLVVKHLQGELTDDENQELQAWIYQSKENELAFEKAIDPENLKEGLRREFEKEERILDQLKSEIEKESETEVIVINAKRKWYRYAAAAAIIIVSTGAFFIFFNREEQEVIVKAPEINDLQAPKANRAMITLANGKTIYLDSAANGILETDGDVKLVKLADGQIVYSGSSNEIIYNTVSNPRGSKIIDITLGDGSRVWLNNESTIKYPISFVGSDRKVEITGEAYFEVAKNAKRKFIVEANGSTTEVLGTHFNVNAYSDEDKIATTLLEGSVRVKKGNVEAILKPGQQSQIGGNTLNVINGADLDAVVAWKNGFVVFSGADMKTVLRQIGRYYDVDIEYKDEINVPELYSKIPRTVSLSEVLKAIEINSKLKFKVEGKKVLVWH
jgi:transmembrane sensor